MSDSVVIALIGAGALILSGITSAVIAYLGFKITLKTSTEANKEIANVSRENSNLTLKHQSLLRLAEMRQQWIEDLRNSFASFSAKSARRFISLKTSMPEGDADVQYEYCYIILKLNMAEENSLKIKKLMESVIITLNELLVSSQSTSEVIIDKEVVSKFNASMTEFNMIATQIMKLEWERLKSEMIFVAQTNQPN